MPTLGYRQQIEDYIRRNASPPDKFSHQARLYRLAKQIAGTQPFDDDIVHAGAWLHDLGVFVGHRPDDFAALASWDHVAYAVRQTPGVLRDCGFPTHKIPAVLEVIRNHMPCCTPESFESTLVRDADILEQLGAVSILRTVSKVGRDTRFVLFSDALGVLQKNARELPASLGLEAARRLAESRILVLQAFLQACEEEAAGIPW